MKHIAFDMSGLSRWQRWKIRWEVRRMGARAIHSPYVLERTAVVFDPEEAEAKLRRDLLAMPPPFLHGGKTQEQAERERRGLCINAAIDAGDPYEVTSADGSKTYFRDREIPTDQGLWT